MGFLEKLMLQQGLKSLANKTGIAVGYFIELLPTLFEIVKKGQELLGSAEFRAFAILAVRKFNSIDQTQAKITIEKMKELLK